MQTQTIRSAKALRKLREAAREAVRAVYALEAVTTDVDVFGRYVLSESEDVDMDEIAEFLNLARAMHPTQELHIVVIAQEGTDKENENGSEQGIQRRS